MSKSKVAKPVCPYCSAPAELVAGDVICPHRPDLAANRFWLCHPCSAYVGVHVGTTKALGRLADADLRAAKVEAHAAFDPLWRSGLVSRRRAYALLATELGVKGRGCHIGEFDLVLCQRIPAACEVIGAGERGLCAWRAFDEEVRAATVKAVHNRGHLEGRRSQVVAAQVLAYVGRR